MKTFALICGLLGVALSILGLLGFTIREHRVEKRRTLSELAVRDPKTLLEFRIILWTCGLLISVMMYGLVIPGLPSQQWFTILYTLLIACELLIAIIPANNIKLGKLHEYIAYTMSIGMLVLAFTFGASLTGVYALTEYVIFGLMAVICLLTIRYWEHFLYFELPYIFLSHVSMLVAAIAVI